MAPEMPVNQPENFGDDLAGMGSFLIDPAGAARRVFSKWFWVGPLILVSIIAIVTSLVRLPITQHVLETMPMPPNANPEQFQRGIAMGMTVQHIFAWLSPVLTAFLYALSALILLAMSSVMGVTAKFGALFNLIAGCSLIQALAAIASVVILKAKGDVSTVAELQPALGLDIFTPEGTNKFVVAFLASFSIFEIWWIVMAMLIYSHAFKVSKRKGFAAILPLILLGMLFRLVGAAFQRT
jgi:hypothetical protein